MNTMTSVDLLTAADEAELSRRVEAGLVAEQCRESGLTRTDASSAELDLIIEQGHQAWQHFWLANLRMVHKVAAAEARLTGLSFDDLFQEGCLALAASLQRFDYRRARFSTFAMQRIQQHVAEVAAGRLGALALPASRAVRLRRVQAVSARLSQSLGREATTAEIAAEFGKPKRWIEQLLSHRPPAHYEDDEAFQVAAPSEDLERSLLCQQLPRLLRKVPSDQAEVLRRRYGLDGADPVPVEWVATELQVSLSTARRLERRALGMLRGWLENDLIPAQAS